MPKQTDYENMTREQLEALVDERKRASDSFRNSAEEAQKHLEARLQDPPLRNILGLLSLWQRRQCVNGAMVAELLSVGFDGADVPPAPNTGNRIERFSPTQVLGILNNHRASQAFKSDDDKTLSLIVHAYMRRLQVQYGVPLTEIIRSAADLQKRINEELGEE